MSGGGGPLIPPGSPASVNTKWIVAPVEPSSLPVPSPIKVLNPAGGGLGLPTLDGLSMLVHQGVIGFKMWTGQDAPVDVMKQALREAFGS